MIIIKNFFFLNSKILKFKTIYHHIIIRLTTAIKVAKTDITLKLKYTLDPASDWTANG